MIDVNAVWERISQLTDERGGLAEQVQRGLAELERLRHLISAYDGAIGELQRLGQQAGDAAGVEPAQAE